MIVLSVTNCPPALRGDLSKWLSEINTGVYVGKLSARVREELWERVRDHIKTGQATMVYTANNEQGYEFLTHNTVWRAKDYEGITLMQRPLLGEKNGEEAESVSFLKPGFSKAAKFEKARYFQKRNQPISLISYIVLDVETTGLDYNRDRVIEMALLRIRGDEIEAQLSCLIRSVDEIPEGITELTGITMEMLEKEGITEEEAVDTFKEFIGTDLIVGYQVLFDMNFIQRMGERVGKSITIQKVKDVLQLARRKLDDLDSYKLETVAAFLSLDTTGVHRAMVDCMLTYHIYKKLNEI